MTRFGVLASFFGVDELLVGVGVALVGVDGEEVETLFGGLDEPSGSTLVILLSGVADTRTGASLYLTSSGIAGNATGLFGGEEGGGLKLNSFCDVESFCDDESCLFRSGSGINCWEGFRFIDGDCSVCVCVEELDLGGRIRRFVVARSVFPTNRMLRGEKIY